METKRNTASSILINVLILAAGVVMIAGFKRAEFLKTLIFITGIIFIFPGIINFFELLKSKSETDKGGSSQPKTFPRMASMIGSIGAIALGILMCVNPGLFLTFYIIILGVVLILAGLVNFYMIAFAMRQAKISGLTFVFPSLIIIAGIVILAWPHLAESTIVLIAGIGFILYALARFVELYGRRLMTKIYKQQAANHSGASTIDFSNPSHVKDEQKVGGKSLTDSLFGTKDSEGEDL